MLVLWNGKPNCNREKAITFLSAKNVTIKFKMETMFSVFFMICLYILTMRKFVKCELLDIWKFGSTVHVLGLVWIRKHIKQCHVTRHNIALHITLQMITFVICRSMYIKHLPICPCLFSQPCLLINHFYHHHQNWQDIYMAHQKSFTCNSCCLLCSCQINIDLVRSRQALC